LDTARQYFRPDIISRQNFYDMFGRFDTIPECHERMDRLTDGIDLSIVNIARCIHEGTGTHNNDRPMSKMSNAVSNLFHDMVTVIDVVWNVNAVTSSIHCYWFTGADTDSRVVGIP